MCKQSTDMVRELWDHARISLHNGKTNVCNRGGISNLQQMASKEDPDAVVWRGHTSLPTPSNLLILGTPPWATVISLESISAAAEQKHDVLLQRIPAVRDLQAAWLFLTSCAAARANFTLRTVRPALVEEFAASHNHAIWTCLVKILGIDGSAAQWANWANALEMIRKRRPGVAAEIITAFDQGHSSPFITAVRDSTEWLEAAGLRTRTHRHVREVGGKGETQAPEQENTKELGDNPHQRI